MNNTAIITDIKRFAVHDGDGIRTTVFFKGCPLKCVWCHNPEAISFKPQTAYLEKKCINCHECEGLCEANVFEGIDGISLHRFDAEKCIGCGKCKDICLGEALVFYGRKVSVQELIKVILEDKDFYESSGGGVTVSGGEPLMQADFVAELLKQCKQNGISTAVDTCGFVPREAIDKVADVTDIFLYDIKHIDPDAHKSCTGHGNEKILDNLRYIDSLGKSVEIRIPFVPGYNSDAIDGIGEFLSGLSCIKRIKVLPYHNYAGSKYESLHMENTLPKVELPDDDVIAQAVETLRKYGLNAVSGKEA